MFPVPPPEPWHGDPKGARAFLDENHRQRVGLTHDLVHVGQAAIHRVAWPARRLLRLLAR